MLAYHEILIRLLFAALLGAAIGVERDVHRRPAGVRTSMFVCMATALFTILSGEIAHAMSDTSGTRIASNIVQGIGFLGAGAILKEGGTLVGLTTAATIFAEAAIGMAAGGGFYAVAATATAIVLFGLFALAWVAERFDLRSRTVLFRFTTDHARSVASEIQQLLVEMNVLQQHLRVSMAGGNSVVEFEVEVSHRQQQRIVEQLHREGVITEVLPMEGRQE
jgi:putative Mg2+ transporter-C (MgtC) family protein